MPPSGCGPVHACDANAQDAHVPSLGPVELPCAHRSSVAHHPQPAFVVQSAHWRLSPQGSRAPPSLIIPSAPVVASAGVRASLPVPPASRGAPPSSLGMNTRASCSWLEVQPVPKSSETMTSLTRRPVAESKGSSRKRGRGSGPTVQGWGGSMSGESTSISRLQRASFPSDARFRRSSPADSRRDWSGGRIRRRRGGFAACGAEGQSNE